MSGTALRIVVTGANAGVGREIARDLYSKGHDVIMAVRNVEKGDAAKSEIGTCGIFISLQNLFILYLMCPSVMSSNLAYIS
jgi:NADP-dependent 3-hydroxy acid dehydrogenase YdfG